jgi:hypothetical protein
MMFYKWPLCLTLISLLVLLSAGCSYFHKESQVNMHMDLALENNLNDMIKQAPLVVMGTYQNAAGTINGARDPKDPSKPAKCIYNEVKLFNFKVDKVLKGDLDQDIIKVGQSHTLQLDHLRENENIHITNPLYIEPEMEKTYILFLKKSPYADFYSFPFVPNSIQLNDQGKALLQIPSNHLLNQTVSQGDQTIHVSIDGFPTDYKDTVTGLNLQGILNTVENIEDALLHPSSMVK